MPNFSLNTRHIFYPELKANVDKNDYIKIKDFVLHGFHHDEFGALEKSGLFTYITKTYGQAQYGAQECIAATLDWGNGIIPKIIKTFFPSNWSREKVIQVIFEASQNRIMILDDEKKSPKLFECKGPEDLIIEILVDVKNTIVSAYPSYKNFKGI